MNLFKTLRNSKKLNQSSKDPSKVPQPPQEESIQVENAGSNAVKQPTEENKKYVKRQPVNGVRFLCDGHMQIGPKKHEDNSWNYKTLGEAFSRDNASHKLEAFGPARFENNYPGTSCVKVSYKMNGFFEAAQQAFYEHYPLRLTPDCIWFLIVHGFSEHVNLSPETYRHLFVDFEGKKNIEVVEPSFSKGNRGNDWPSVFPKFKQGISQYIGDDLAGLIDPTFSTSTVISKVCFEIALMDAMQNYFTYSLRGGCGIPFIELAGTPNDWKKIRTNAERLLKLEGLDLDWWADALLPVLDQFVSASEDPRNADVFFWSSICHIGKGSGSSVAINGWAQVFVPYLDSGVQATLAALGRGKNERYRNPNLSQWKKNYDFLLSGGQNPDDGELGDFYAPVAASGSGIISKNVPPAMSRAPFGFTDMNTRRNFDMSFNGGLLAIVQHHDTRALEPVLGYYILEHADVK